MDCRERGVFGDGQGIDIEGFDIGLVCCVEDEKELHIFDSNS
jgi:hypothetical protein